MPETALRPIVVHTQEIAPIDNLLDMLPEDSPLLWWRRDGGILGFGTLATLEFSGKDRITDAASAWREISAASNVTDPLKKPGTGLVALGTFTFHADSNQTSKLVIPRQIIGRRDGSTWLTRFRFDKEPEFGPLNVSLDTAISDNEASLMDQRTPVTLATGALSGAFLPGLQSEIGFHRSVTAALAHIQAGHVEKVVLARELTAQFAEEVSLTAALNRLVESYPDCWTFAVDDFFGSSPETLISVHGQQVSARVLAGTASRGLDQASDLARAADLASSTKDLDEHGFATRSVLSALTPFTSDLTTGESPFTLKLPNVWHLATDISGQLTTGSSALDLVAALHPTAAVAGTPTQPAVELIAQLEPFDRGRYAGPVGWIDANGDGEWAIALRCAQKNGHAVTAYAGGGIVADSIPEKEFTETSMKFRPIIEALA